MRELAPSIIPSLPGLSQEKKAAGVEMMMAMGANFVSPLSLSYTQTSLALSRGAKVQRTKEMGMV